MNNSNSFWQNKKVLITGHTGFKGSWLTVCLLEKGSKVSGISLEPNTKPSLFNELEISGKLENNYFLDIREKTKIQEIISNIKPDIVFHLAAQPLVRESYKDPLGTWDINVIGSLNILSSLKEISNLCGIVMITTDKVYKNKEWQFGYRENDELGGYDPYSASKAACEIAIESWRLSYCNPKNNNFSNLAIATARSGNVIGGGDWARDRIIPDSIIALKNNKEILIRNPESKRPWQHVLEPISGYLSLAEKLYINQKNLKIGEENSFSTSFNFGSNLDSNKKVSELVNQILNSWPGKWRIANNEISFHEAKQLYLNTDKAYRYLNWSSRWDFNITINRTVEWYKKFYSKEIKAYDLCIDDINYYEKIRKISKNIGIK